MATKVKIGDLVRVRLDSLKQTTSEAFARVTDIVQDPQRDTARRKGWIRAEVLYLTGPFAGLTHKWPHNRLYHLSLLEKLAVEAADHGPH